MKPFLFLMLFSFSVHAQSVDPNVHLPSLLSNIGIDPSIVFGGFSNPHQVYSSVSPYCVENNFDNCVGLGYTVSSQQMPCTEGIACPYDPTLWNCSAWRCKELGLLVTIPPYMECEAITVANIKCYKCFCKQNFINYEGCDGLIKTLTSDETVCDELGYTDLVTDCAKYIPCPANVSKVRCLDVVGCKETSCISTSTVPSGALPIYENKNCSCGGTKKVITGWKCQDAYKKEGNRCVQETCAANEFEGPRIPNNLSNDEKQTILNSASQYNIEDCYTAQGGNAAEGWKKELSTEKDGLLCYKCVCDLSEDCKYTVANKGVDGRLSDKCCDGEHYKTCTSSCESDKHMPSVGAVAVMGMCDACGKQKEFIAGWSCKKGYVLSASERSCDIRECPQNGNGKYYKEDYTSLENCLTINTGEGWQFTAQPEEAPRGDGFCGKCYCPLNEMLAQGYKYSKADEQNSSIVDLDTLGCNGKYKNCEIKEQFRDNYIPEGYLPAHALKRSYKICGKVYYEMTGCETGYKYDAETKECLPDTCDSGYNIEGRNCPEGAKCSYCFSGNNIRTKIESCIYAPRYIIDEFGTACCDSLCGDDSGEYIVPEVEGQCPEGKTLVPNDTKLNECHQECIRCK